MYSYTSVTLAIRAKCSLSYYYLSLPRDQQHCCHCRCCNFPTNTLFPISSCILSRNLLGQYFKVPSRTLLHVGSRRPRDFSRSCNSEMMELLVKAEERLSDSEQLDRKSVRREVEIKSVEGKRQSSIKEGKTGGSFSTRSEGLNSTVTSSSTLLRDLELNRTRRRRASVESLVGYGNKKRGAKFYSHDAAAEEAPEVHKHVDDSCRGRRYSSNEDVLLDSTKGGYMKENVRSRQLGVKNELVHVEQQSNLSQQVINWETRSHRSSEKASRKLETWSDDLKNAAVSANVKKNEKGESSASEARQSSSMDRVVRHDELRRSQDKESKLSDFHYSDVQNATYAQRDFQVTDVSGREDKKYLKQNSAQLTRDNRIHFDQKAVEKYESTSSNQKLSEVSVLNDSDFVNSSRVDEKSLQGIELRSNLVQDSGQVFGEEMTRMVLERPLENKLEEWQVKLSMEGNSIQVGRSGGKQFGRRELQHHDFSEVHSSNVETSSLLKGRITGMESKYNSVQSSSPATNDIGVQVEMDDAMFNAGVESQREPNEFDVTRRNTRRISILQQENKSKTEKKKETSSVKTSASLTQEEMQRSSLTIDSSNSASIQMTSAGSFDGISISQPTHNELNVQTGTDSVHQMQNNSTESASNLVKSSASHDKKICKKIAGVDESGKKHFFSSGIQIGEPGRGKMQSTFKTEDQKETFSTELTQERKEKISTLFLEEGSESKTTEMASTSFPSSLKSHSEVDSDSRTAAENKFKGPSDEMWDVQGTFSSKASITEEPEEELPTSGAIALTIPAPTFSKETAMTRRSPKSLWSYVSDIIRMSWILRGHSHGSTLGSDKRASSEESLSSEAWFSGHEPDEAVAGDETQHEEIISLPTNSGSLKGSVDFFFEKGKNGDRLATTDLMKKGLSAESHSSSEEAKLKVDAKSSHDMLSSDAIIEQRLMSKADTTSPFTSGIVESSVRDKVKMLKPCLSYPVAVKKVGFSSSITQATDAAQMEASLLMEDSNSGLDYFREPSIPTVDSTLPIVTEIVEVDKSESSIPKLELEPLREILPEVHGYKEPEIKQRKFSRNKQVLKEHFDGWEEAFKLENEQKKLDEFYMREAILEAKKGADTWEVPVGAVLVQNGKIIARGCNMVEELRDSTAHAEMICIRDASNLLRTWRLAETTLYVTLEPCAMCAGAILQARVDSVVWGAPNKLLGADGSWVRLFPGEIGESGYMDPPRQHPGPVHPFHPKIKVRRGVLETECGEVMQQFFKLRRKKDKKPDPSPPACLPITNKPTKFFSKLHNIFSLMFCL